MILKDIFEQSLFSGDGTCSTFGGERDTGVKSDEPLALAQPTDLIVADSPLNGLWLPVQPEGTTGMARRLNQWAFYCACRWDYNKTSVEVLRKSYLVVMNNVNRRVCLCRPVDWGPNSKTGRKVDLSPGAAGYLGVHTGSVLTFALWTPTL